MVRRLAIKREAALEECAASVCQIFFAEGRLFVSEPERPCNLKTP